MIFVTVGTHEQPFNRLIQYIDNLKRDGVIQEDVVMQTGFSTYTPKYCKYQELYPYKEMEELTKQARIVITHGGPSSFIMPLQEHKVPIVVPRRKEFHEHVNDHQVEFCKTVAKRQKNILVIEKIDDLKDAILNYDTLVQGLVPETVNNNARFNEEFEQVIGSMFTESGEPDKPDNQTKTKKKHSFFHN